MTWEIAKADHIGGREEQQDRVEAMVSDDGTVCVLAVADGMGGHEGGSLAAQCVIDVAREMIAAASLPLDDPRDFLRQVCEDSHRRINRLGNDPRCTCAVFYGDKRDGHWVSVGDSRLYRFHGRRVKEQTRDQSVVQLLVDMGRITEEQMATHPDQNLLLGSLGGDDDPDLQFGTARIEAGDSVLLCSDGLWETVKEREMSEAVAADSLVDSAAGLVARCADRAGPSGDNIAFAVGRYGGRPARGGWLLAAAAIVLTIVAAGAAYWLYSAPQ